MAKERDLEPAAADNSTRNEGTPPCTEPKTGLTRSSEWFTLKIISRNGQSYYEVDSDSLGPPMPIGNDPTLNDLIAKQVDVAHVPYVSAEPDEYQVAYCGTYFVNLHVFK